MVSDPKSLRVGVLFLTDVELVSEVPDANARELSANEAEDPVGCDCGGCTPNLRVRLAVVSL
jgi:hypothetical protein